MRSYLIPLGLVALVAAIAGPAWWATAMLAGGSVFAWDYLWGDARVLNGAHGLKMVGVGVALFVVSLALVRALGVSLAEFQEFANYMERRAGMLYQLPAIGVGLVLYGLLVWSGAWAREREG